MALGKRLAQRRTTLQQIFSKLDVTMRCGRVKCAQVKLVINYGIRSAPGGGTTQPCIRSS